MKVSRHILTLLTPIVLILTTGCASTGTIHEAEVQSKYDSVEGVTLWSHTPILVKNYGLASGATVNMQAVAVCQGEHNTPCDNPGWGLFFQVQGDRLTGNTDLVIRLGDRRIRPGTGSYDADTGGLLAFKEELVYPLNREDVGELAQLPDGEVEGRLAGIDLNLSYERRKAVRLLYQKFTDGS